MGQANSIREALTSGRFSYIVELVASQLTREAKLFQTASDLARVPGLIGAGITSYAGGSLGHDPIRVGTAARARGLTPNVHITCVNRSREQILRALEDLYLLGIENVFAITGDYPQSKGKRRLRLCLRWTRCSWWRRSANCARRECHFSLRSLFRPLSTPRRIALISI